MFSQRCALHIRSGMVGIVSSVGCRTGYHGGWWRVHDFWGIALFATIANCHGRSLQTSIQILTVVSHDRTRINSTRMSLGQAKGSGGLPKRLPILGQFLPISIIPRCRFLLLFPPFFLLLLQQSLSFFFLLLFLPCRLLFSFLVPVTNSGSPLSGSRY